MLARLVICWECTALKIAYRSHLPFGTKYHCFPQAVALNKITSSFLSVSPWCASPRSRGWSQQKYDAKVVRRLSKSSYASMITPAMNLGCLFYTRMNENSLWRENAQNASSLLTEAAEKIARFLLKFTPKKWLLCAGDGNCFNARGETSFFTETRIIVSVRLQQRIYIKRWPHAHSASSKMRWHHVRNLVAIFASMPKWLAQKYNNCFAAS